MAMQNTELPMDMLGRWQFVYGRIQTMKNYFSGTYDRAKKQPIIYAGLFFILAYGLLTTIIGGFQLSFYMGFTGAYLLVFGFTKFTSYENYKIIQKFDMVEVLKERE